VIGSFQAGADILLCPQNFVEAFDAIAAAVQNGAISEERLNRSVRRILTIKLKKQK